jgi:hypothetical protein
MAVKGYGTVKISKVYVSNRALTGRFCLVKQAGKKLSDKEECPDPPGGNFQGRLVTPSHKQVEYSYIQQWNMYVKSEQASLFVPRSEEVNMHCVVERVGCCKSASFGNYVKFCS